MVAIDNRDRRNNYSKNRSSNHHAEKLRLRAWLQQEANRGTIPGLQWRDEDRTELRIPWLHGSKQSWSINDVMLFQRWAEHTGRYSSDDICPKRWKANFRCALKSLSDVVELQCCGQTRGKDAFRVYKFLEPAQASKKHGVAAKNYRVDHQCKNRRRTTSGSVTTSCPSPLVAGSESSITGSDEEAMEDDSFRDDASSEDASIEDVFDVAYEINDLQQPAFLPAEDMSDVNLLLHEFQQSGLSLGELFSGMAVDHNYSAADLSEFNGNASDDGSELLPLGPFDFEVNPDQGVVSEKNTGYNLPDIDSLMSGMP